MQKHRILLASAVLACAPLGCATVSDIFNEPPAETQRTEPAEERDGTAQRRTERPEPRQRTAEQREAREEARERQQQIAREEAREREEREARPDRRTSQREAAREEARERAERAGDRSQARLARDYIAASSCPMQVDGARVSMVDIVDGIALDFQAEDDDDVEQIQERARRLASTQRQVSSTRDIDDPDLEALPPARVEYDIQRQGARIEFKVDSQAELNQLRTQLRERISIMNDENQCPRDFMAMRSRSGRAG